MDNPKRIEQENLRKKFKEACKPLQDFLIENYHPHAYAIVNIADAEIVEGSLSVELLEEKGE